MKKNLQQLLPLLPKARVDGVADIMITGIEQDSRQIQPGNMFVCLPGSKVDGNSFATAAIERGAVAILTSSAVNVSGITNIVVDDVRLAMQQMVPAFYDYPGQKLKLLAVTGTNGKTTTTYLLQSILQMAGCKCGVIGTIQSICGSEIIAMKNTTPDVPELQKLLHYMVERGMEYVAIEVSSHALELARTVGCHFPLAIFTNLTQDHLDFHKTFDAYHAAKAKLFANLQPIFDIKQPIAVLNIDDEAADAFTLPKDCRRISYAIDKVADFWATDIKLRTDGMDFLVQGPNGSERLAMPITGNFNVYNVLSAIAAASALGISWHNIANALRNFSGVAGRFELVKCGQNFPVVVDYAHTPDGLKNVLQTARELTKNRLITVFGCGGDRDRSKRPLMGEIAAFLSDIIVITSDNPRSENPQTIIEDIIIGANKYSTNCQKSIVEIDRKLAIKVAVDMAREGDVVVIAGKGHETYQILADRTIDFDDRLIAKQMIEECKNV